VCQCLEGFVPPEGYTEHHDGHGGVEEEGFKECVETPAPTPVPSADHSENPTLAPTPAPTAVPTEMPTFIRDCEGNTLGCDTSTSAAAMRDDGICFCQVSTLNLVLLSFAPAHLSYARTFALALASPFALTSASASKATCSTQLAAQSAWSQ
jgi:hypothetical protein